MIVRPAAAGEFPVILESSPYHGTLADRDGTRILPEPRDADNRSLAGGRLTLEWDALTPTTNGGRSWQVISPDLTNAEPHKLLDSGGVAQPDRVDYAPDEVIFRWSEEKLAVVLDMDSPPGTVSVPQRQEATPSPPMSR